MVMRSSRLVAGALLSVFVFVAMPGCGDEAHETGTQVQVTDEMTRQAEASSKFMEEQSKAKAPAKAAPK